MELLRDLSELLGRTDFLLSFVGKIESQVWGKADCQKFLAYEHLAIVSAKKVGMEEMRLKNGLQWYLPDCRNVTRTGLADRFEFHSDSLAEKEGVGRLADWLSRMRQFRAIVSHAFQSATKESESVK